MARPVTGDDDEDGPVRIATRLAGWLMIFLLLNAGVWLFSDRKMHVIVLGEDDGVPSIRAEYERARDSLFLAMPSALMRLAGMETPRVFQGPGGTVEVAAIPGWEGNNLLLVNPTGRDFFYTALARGALERLPPGAVTGTMRVPAGTGVAAFDLSWDRMRLGCANRPDEAKFQASGASDGDRIAMIGWVSEQEPADCAW